MTDALRDQPRASGSSDDPFDLVVVGGGINGAGVARDAVRRGMSVALFEKRDFGVGATANSSGMIHGGIRYLLKDPHVTKLACIDSGYIQRIAGHLIFRIPFVFPVLGGGFQHKAFLELTETYFSVYDRYQPLKRGQPHCRLDAAELRSVEPGITKRAIGAVTTDEWGIDAARLNLINAVDAAENGALIQTYHEVVALLRDDARVVGVRVRDRLTGETREVYGRIVVNAAGAWTNGLARLAGVKRPLVRPGQGIHVVFPGRISNYAVISRAIDGREIFMCPHQNETWIGTTDDDYWGDLDDVPVLEDEIRYLINGIERVFPTIGQHRVSRTMVGCRPTLYAYGPSESKLSREHELYDHTADGASGFYTIAGGKLASYRVMAEEFVDHFAKKLGVTRPCETHVAYLPGGEPHDLTPAAFTELGLDIVAARRLLYRHGSRAEGIRELMRREPRTRAIVDPSDPVTEAELRYVLRTEMVRTLDDCTRRVKLGQGHSAGGDCAHRAAQIFCEERGRSASDVPDVARSFMANTWPQRQMATSGAQLAQEELGRAWFFLSAAADASDTRPFVGSEPSRAEAVATVDAVGGSDRVEHGSLEP